MKLHVKALLGALVVGLIGTFALSIAVNANKRATERHVALQLQAMRHNHGQMCDRIRNKLWMAEMHIQIGPGHPKFQADVIIGALVNSEGLDRLCVTSPASTVTARRTLFQRGGADVALTIAGVRDLIDAMDEAARAGWPLPTP